MRLFYRLIAKAFGLPIPGDVYSDVFPRPLEYTGGMDFGSIQYARRHNRRGKIVRRYR